MNLPDTLFWHTCPAHRFFKATLISDLLDSPTQTTHSLGLRGTQIGSTSYLFSCQHRGRRRGVLEHRLVTTAGDLDTNEDESDFKDSDPATDISEADIESAGSIESAGDSDDEDSEDENPSSQKG